MEQSARSTRSMRLSERGDICVADILVYSLMMGMKVAVQPGVLRNARVRQI